MPSISTKQPELGAGVRQSPEGLNRHVTGKLTHWAKLLVGCTLGLTVIFVSLRLWDKIHIVILFPEDLRLHHIPTLFIKPSVSVLNLPPPAPPPPFMPFSFCFVGLLPISSCLL